MSQNDVRHRIFSFLGYLGQSHGCFMPWLLVSPGHQHPYHYIDCAGKTGPCLAQGRISRHWEITKMPIPWHVSVFLFLIEFNMTKVLSNQMTCFLASSGGVRGAGPARSDTSTPGGGPGLPGEYTCPLAPWSQCWGREQEILVRWVQKIFLRAWGVPNFLLALQNFFSISKT